VDLDARVVEPGGQATTAPEILAEVLLWNPLDGAEPLSIGLEDFFRAVLD
jgi:hypothetical protein